MEALFEAIQSWAKSRGYAFSVGKSKKQADGRRKVYYACDRNPLLRSHIQRVRETQSCGTRCLFSILALETLSLGWEIRYRPESLALIHITTLLAKVQLHTHHIGSLQFQSKIQQ
jgi:hypothetical protein